MASLRPPSPLGLPHIDTEAPATAIEVSSNTASEADGTDSSTESAATDSSGSCVLVENQPPAVALAPDLDATLARRDFTCLTFHPRW